jgi:hypothetical protein
MSATEPAPAADAPPPQAHGIHKIGLFIEKYSTFLSSFILGLAGLIATALYQNQNTKISQKQAEAQIAVSQNDAEVRWKIARAEILGKNLNLLLDKKPETTDQRYGVLLSLTREDVLDPELAMSYAFDLDNAEYISSVILNIQHKSWAQIFHNFNLTCDLRYGIRKNVPVCVSLDKYDARSEAMADVVSEELDRGNKEPFKLLSDDKQVKSHLMRLTYLFAPYLEQTWQRERLSDIEAFEKQGRGAQIVAAFALAADPAGEAFATPDHSSERTKFHEVRQKRMHDLVFDASCDVECKGIAAEMLLNGLEEYGGAYASLLSQMLLRAGPEYTQVVQRLNRRLLWCQLSRGAADKMLREVLVPAWNEITSAKPVKDKEKEKEKDRAKDAIADMAALIEPSADFKVPETLLRAADSRRSRAKKDRETPPPALKKSNFCAARDDEPQPGNEDL